MASNTESMKTELQVKVENTKIGKPKKSMLIEDLIKAMVPEMKRPFQR